MEGTSHQLVSMCDVYSNEYYKQADNSTVQVLRGISFEARRGQAWSILGNSIFEIMLMTEIMAGAKAYQSGQCSLAGFGMMRRKGTALSHTIYIGSTNMLFSNMKVLEYLMFATSKSGTDALTRQQQILDTLIDIGLDYIALTPIEQLDPPEKAAVILLSATFSQGQLFIMNLPRLCYDARLLGVMAKISELIRRENKALIMTTECYELAEAISTGILVINKGTVQYCGELADFLKRYDKVAYTIESELTEDTLPLLSAALPNYTFRADKARENTVDIFDYSDSNSGAALLREFAKISFIPQNIRRNKPNVKNAYRELMREYDL